LIKHLKSIFEILSKTNYYVDEQAPWEIKKTNAKRIE
jgi:Methionyl-tRNA synthetase